MRNWLTVDPPVGVWLSLRMLEFGRELDPYRPRRERARARVYRALLDARTVAPWKLPTRATGHVHVFDAHEGGSFRVSLR